MKKISLILAVLFCLPAFCSADDFTVAEYYGLPLSFNIKMMTAEMKIDGKTVSLIEWTDMIAVQVVCMLNGKLAECDHFSATMNRKSQNKEAAYVYLFYLKEDNRRLIAEVRAYKEKPSASELKSFLNASQLK